MTREEAIKLLVNATYSDEWQGNEDLTTAHNMAIKALKQEPCDDAINRQAVLDEAFEIDTKEYGRIEVVGVDAINSLTPVTPQPKKGHWIEKDGFDGDAYYDCSECGESWTTIEGTPWQNGMHYCPNCGCAMVEPQESEDKE